MLPALTTKKGSFGIARPEALQRLQLRTGSRTRTSRLPRHTGHRPFSIGLPAQNPHVFGEYADILGPVRNLELDDDDEALCGSPKNTPNRSRIVVQVRCCTGAGSVSGCSWPLFRTEPSANFLPDPTRFLLTHQLRSGTTRVSNFESIPHGRPP